MTFSCLSKRGLSVATNVFSEKLKVSIVQVTGDSLGVNEILGYVESFVINHYLQTL